MTIIYVTDKNIYYLFFFFLFLFLFCFLFFFLLLLLFFFFFVVVIILFICLFVLSSTANTAMTYISFCQYVNTLILKRSSEDEAIIQNILLFEMTGNGDWEAHMRERGWGKGA